MKLSISTTLFYGNHIFDVLPELKGACFDGLELRLKEPHFDYNEDREIKELKKRAKKNKVKILSVHAPSGIDISATDEWERVRSVREVEKGIVIASRVGADYIVVHPGEEISDYDTQMKMVKRSFDEIIEFSEEWGVLVLVENLPPHKIGFDLNEIKNIIGWYNKGDIGCCLDTSHLNLCEIKMSDAINLLNEYIINVHVSDNQGEQDDHTLPYKGEIDWEDFIAGLKSIDFNGTLCFELMKEEQYLETIEQVCEIYDNWVGKLGK
jgi:sugar phosphate isomerase/epimerase